MGCSRCSRTEPSLLFQPFRDASGSPIDGYIKLLPTDFVPPSFSAGLPDLDQTLVLNYGVLNVMLSTAEQQYELSIRPPLNTDVPSAGFAVASPDHSSTDEKAPYDEPADEKVPLDEPVNESIDEPTDEHVSSDERRYRPVTNGDDGDDTSERTTTSNKRKRLTRA